MDFERHGDAYGFDSGDFGNNPHIGRELFGKSTLNRAISHPNSSTRCKIHLKSVPYGIVSERRNASAGAGAPYSISNNAVMVRVDMFSKFKAAGVAAVLTCFPVLVSAASIKIHDMDSGLLVAKIKDTGDLTSAGVLAGNNTAGGMNFTIAATPLQTATESRLGALNIAASGAGWLRVQITENGFDTGAGLGASLLNFEVTASRIGGRLRAKAFANNRDKLFGKRRAGVSIGRQILFKRRSEIAVNGATRQVSASLNSPFSMTSVFYIRHFSDNATTYFDADQVATASLDAEPSNLAPVPVPAAGLLLLTALGGLRLARRGRKAT